MALIDYIWGVSSIDLGREEMKGKDEDKDKARDAKEDQEGISEDRHRFRFQTLVSWRARPVAAAHEPTGDYLAVCTSTAGSGGKTGSLKLQVSDA